MMSVPGETSISMIGIHDAKIFDFINLYYSTLHYYFTSVKYD